MFVGKALVSPVQSQVTVKLIGLHEITSYRKPENLIGDKNVLTVCITTDEYVVRMPEH